MAAQKDGNEIKLNAFSFKELTQKSPWPWLRDTFIDWAVIAGIICAARLWNNPAGYVLAIMLIGNRQHALAILGHDGTHFTITRSKKINDTLTNVLTFWSLGLTTSGYRNLHFQHHRYANTVNDPELQHRGAKTPQWDLPVTLRKVLKYAALDLVGYSLSDYLMIVSFAKPDRKISYVWLVAFHTFFITIAIVSGVWWVPVLWYTAVTTSFMMFFRLRTWLEHQGSDDTHRIHLNWLERILLSPHYAWYHYEHHHWPSIPYYRLPELRKLMKDKPIITLRELIKSYESMPLIPSGKALKVEKDSGDVLKVEQALAA